MSGTEAPPAFVLTPCKLRNDRIVPQKGAPVVSLDWKGLVLKLAASRQAGALANLRHMDKGSFVGLAREQRTGLVRNFILKNPDRSDRVDWLLERDPTFADRLVEVYRVENANWDTSVVETDTPEQRTT